MTGKRKNLKKKNWTERKKNKMKWKYYNYSTDMSQVYVKNYKLNVQNSTIDQKN